MNRHNEAALRLAKQKKELELDQLKEENRKRRTKAHAVDLELQYDTSEIRGNIHETLSNQSLCVLRSAGD